MIYSTVEPFGEDRADIRMAQLASAIMIAGGKVKRDKKSFTPSDFLPLIPDERDMEPDEISARLRELFAGVPHARKS